MLAHIGEIVSATDLPVNADYESGYAHDPGAVAENVRLCIATGVAGLSIEDATGDPGAPLYELRLAVERIRAARQAVDASGSGIMLTARAEPYLVGHDNPLAEAVARLEAYADAGADVLYAPGPRSAAEIRTIVDAVAPRPVNILVSGAVGLTVSDLASLGVRRISVGSGLARAAWAGFMDAAEGIAESGRFDGFCRSRPFAEINEFFRKDAGARL
jgi:2-methylisocitrate lyase-like PEP mutase family enzyme